MRSAQILLAASVGALYGMPATAAVITNHLSTDAEMLGLIQQKIFVAEGRIGDLGGNATFEIDLGTDTSAPASTANYGWPLSQAVDLTLTYDGNTFVSFTVDDGVQGPKTVSFNLPAHPSVAITDMFVRVKASYPNTSLTVDNMVLNSLALGETVTATQGGTQLDILRVQGASLSGGFTLTGKSTWTYVAPVFDQSQTAFQIKLTYVPEPASLLFVSAAAAALLRRTRKAPHP